MCEPRDYEAPLCAQVGGDLWFPESVGDHSISREHINLAKSICRKCTHQFECAEWGIHNERFGIWGGHTSRDLISIRRRRNIAQPKEGRSA